MSMYQCINVSIYQYVNVSIYPYINISIYQQIIIPVSPISPISPSSLITLICSISSKTVAFPVLAQLYSTVYSTVQYSSEQVYSTVQGSSFPLFVLPRAACGTHTDNAANDVMHGSNYLIHTYIHT